jgi:hypothetical protein
MYWLCSKQKCLLCAYECNFGDNDIITIVKTGLTTKKYVAFLSVLNLVSEFVKCNRLIGGARKEREGVKTANYHKSVVRTYTKGLPDIRHINETTIQE